MVNYLAYAIVSTSNTNDYSLGFCINLLSYCIDLNLSDCLVSPMQLHVLYRSNAYNTATCTYIKLTKQRLFLTQHKIINEDEIIPHTGTTCAAQSYSHIQL